MAENKDYPQTVYPNSYYQGKRNDRNTESFASNRQASGHKGRFGDKGYQNNNGGSAWNGKHHGFKDNQRWGNNGGRGGGRQFGRGGRGESDWRGGRGGQRGGGWQGNNFGDWQGNGGAKASGDWETKGDTVEKKGLLDDDDDVEGDGFGTLKVNEEYAKRFQHNKEREDLHRLKEMEKWGEVGRGEDGEDSDSEEEDEDGLLPEKTDSKIFETLAKLRKKDPAIYKPDVKFFDEEEDEEDNEEGGKVKSKEKKPLYLKDVVAQQLLSKGDAEDEEDDEEDEGDDDDDGSHRRRREKDGASRLIYDDEQKEIKQAFLAEIGGDEDEEEDDMVGGLLKVRKKVGGGDDEEEEAGQSNTHQDIVERLNEYFGKDEEMDEGERFLRDYLLNKGWVDRDANHIPTYKEVVGEEVSEDEEQLELQDKFEAQYNFRFQEAGASQVAGHSRVVEGSVRRMPEVRKQQRQRKEEREAEEMHARKEEVKRLKNLKRKEIMERLKKIRQVAGVDATEDDEEGARLVGLTAEDLDADFDPVAYDQRMQSAFGDEYYGSRDPDLKSLKEREEELMEDDGKPNFDDEDEILGLPKGWDGRPAKRPGFEEIRQKLKSGGMRSGDEEGGEDEGEEMAGGEEDEGEEVEREEEEVEKESLRKAKKKRGRISLKEKMAFDKQLEEYYKLDFEDLIGDLPTRFKYKQVQPNLYGLSSEDVLLLDDKDLNQHVSLKKLAPYRTEEFVLDKQSRRQLLSKKERKVSALEYHGDGRVKKNAVGGHGGGEEEEGGERKHSKGGKEKKHEKKLKRGGKGESTSEVEEVHEEIEIGEKVKGKKRNKGEGVVEGEETGGKRKSGGEGEGVEGGEERKKRKRNKKKNKESAGLSLSRLQSYGQEALPVQNRKKADGAGFFKRLREEAKK